MVTTPNSPDENTTGNRISSPYPFPKWERGTRGALSPRRFMSIHVGAQERIDLRLIAASV